MARILCVWSPNWAIANWRRRNPSASSPEVGQGDALPFALITTERGVRRLAAVSDEAAALGLFAGQKATDAAALAPDLITADAEAEADAAALRALAEWCVRFSPAVATDAPDGLFLDIAGADHLWGGEAAMMADLRARLDAGGIPTRAAVADTPGAAWALAHFGEEDAIAPPGGQGAMLARLPVQALRLEAQTTAQIVRLGLVTIGLVTRLPRAQLARRFGQIVMLRLDQALGQTEEALTFRRPPNPWFTRLAFAEPISAPEDLARVSLDIAAALCARLDAEGHGARSFELCFHRLDGKAARLIIGLSLPGRDAKAIARLFAPKLEMVDPGFGIEVVTLTADQVEPLSQRQQRLDATREITVEEGLAPLVDRLANRLGEDRVWRARPYASHSPERAVTRAPPLSPGEAEGWDPARPRPLRLFRRPEPIDDVLALLPDNPPVSFRWRGQTHKVRLSEGPERLAQEWWRLADFDDSAPGQVRDYYQIEDDAGARFWIFRAGLYGGSSFPKWWLHGLFS
jgi:protein ImuB